MKHYIEFKINPTMPSRLELISIEPESNFVEEMFYNDTLFRDVDLDDYDYGKFRLQVWVAEDGYVSVNCLQRWLGWVDIEY
jgi:hypothetical protein